MAKWAPEEVARLKELANQNNRIPAIALELRRSPGSIRSMIHELRKQGRIAGPRVGCGKRAAFLRGGDLKALPVEDINELETFQPAAPPRRIAFKGRDWVRQPDGKTWKMA